ncbi:MAG: DUF1540 domain-containing protein [Tepidanaerobacteraceae bacterium]|jgi:hypothetical protein|nr:DUF1540 domain-containing protein [Thermoanaerobacterales bacterium]
MAKNNKTPNPEVKCVVNTCTHWLPANLCGAGNIDILNEEVGKMSVSQEQTMCKTFEERRGLANFIGSADNVNWVGFAEELVGIGRKLNPTVTCIVDTCKYYQEGDLCNIDTIEITGRDAKECQATDCATFEYNGKKSNNEKLQKSREKGEKYI